MGETLLRYRTPVDQAGTIRAYCVRGHTQVTANAGIHISFAVDVGIGADIRGQGSVRLGVAALATGEVPASQRRVVDKSVMYGLRIHLETFTHC
jgi:hypothetical protein